MKQQLRHLLFTLLFLLLPGSLLYSQTRLEILFQVNMSEQLASGRFGAGDPVAVRGEHNGWAGCDAMSDEDGDGIYELEVKFENLGPGLYEYKYFICLTGRWEEFGPGVKRAGCAGA